MVSLSSLLGCSRTTKEVPSSAAAMRVEFIIEESSRRFADNSADADTRRVEATIRDKDGKAVESASLHVAVNDAPMKLHTWNDNYYGRYAVYKLEPGPTFKLEPQTTYRITVQNGSGERVPAGQVATPFPLTEKQLTVPRTVGRDEPVRIAWRDLAGPVELVVNWTYGPINSQGEPDDTGRPLEENTIKNTIGPKWFRSGSGELTLSVAELSRPGCRVDQVVVYFRVNVEGQPSGNFLPDSKLTATRSWDYVIERR